MVNFHIASVDIRFDTFDKLIYVQELIICVYIVVRPFWILWLKKSSIVYIICICNFFYSSKRVDIIKWNISSKGHQPSYNTGS